MGMFAQAQSENYDTQMSNTAIQRQSADAEAAGINPMTFANSGSMAASTPTSSGYSSGGLVEAASSAVQAATSISQIGLNSANAAKSLADASNQTASVQSQIGLNSAQASLANANAREVSKNSASRRSAETKFSDAAKSQAGSARSIEPLFDGVNQLAQTAVNAFSGLFK
nr:MAG: DNA pilot protein [Microvirus sp.]